MIVMIDIKFDLVPFEKFYRARANGARHLFKSVHFLGLMFNLYTTLSLD